MRVSSRDITWLAAREEQLIDEHLVSLGRRTALERSALGMSLVHTNKTLK